MAHLCCRLWIGIGTIYLSTKIHEQYFKMTFMDIAYSYTVVYSWQGNCVSARLFSISPPEHFYRQLLAFWRWHSIMAYYKLRQLCRSASFTRKGPLREGSGTSHSHMKKLSRKENKRPKTRQENKHSEKLIVLLNT